ncbi:MAG: LamG-like jellyroll fold domain-containing protein [Candidatus Omnitrophota bacterium]
MSWPIRTSPVFKTIACVMAFVFLWQQLVWAGDLIDITMDKLNADQSQTFAPEYLQSQQAIHEDIISQQQAMEYGMNLQASLTTEQHVSDGSELEPDSLDIELQGPKGGMAPQSYGAAPYVLMGGSPDPQEEGAILSVTTAIGDVIHYKDGKIDYIEKKDASGDIIIRALQGQDLVDEDNNLLNAEIAYYDGTIEVVAVGKVINITKPDKTLIEYDDQERVQWVTYKDADGIVTLVVNYLYDQIDPVDGAMVTILSDVEKICYYGSDKKIKRVEFATGKKIKYENGILSEVREEDGTVYIYGTLVEQGESGIEYKVEIDEIADASNNRFYFEGSRISSIKFCDGTIVSDYQLDGSGNLVNGKIVYTDGSEKLIENRRIKEEKDASGFVTKYEYVDHFEGNGKEAIVTGNLDGDGKSDFIIDFGLRDGIWIKYGSGDWEQLHDLSPKSIVTGDIGGDGKDEIIIDFGSQYGVWARYSDGSWSQLHNLSPESITVGNLDGEGKDEIIIDFGPEFGIWITYSDGSWSQLHNLSPESITVGNLDGDGKDEIVIDFGPQYGIWISYSNGSWGSVSNVSPESIVVGDVNGDSKDEIIIDFGPEFGIWITYSDGSWSQLHNLSAEYIAIGDLDGDNKSDTIIDFGSQYGIWVCHGNGNWSNPHNLSPCSMTIGDSNGNDLADLIIDFGSPEGIWVAEDSANWFQLSTISPGSIISGAYESGDPKMFIYTEVSRARDFNFSLELPGDMFDVEGCLNSDYDFSTIPYFNTVTYNENGVITEIVKPDGEIICYSDGLPASVTSDVDGSAGSFDTTLYSYDLSGLDNIKEMTIIRDGIKRIYDEYGNIESLSLDDATKIVYENGQIKEIQKSDGTTIRKSNGADDMFFREGGELNDALVSYPDGSMAIYDDGELLQLINALGDITDYNDGKIRKVTLEDGTIYDWSYDGNNIVIVDNSRQERRTYLEGILLELEELAGAKLITKYYYDETSKNLIRSEICQNNDMLYTYTYTYDNGLTLVHDEDGNTQAYTKDKKLSYIVDSKGRKYSYTYVGQNEGYAEVYFPSGTKVRYALTGQIIDITKTDGTFIKDIVFDSNNVPQSFTYIKDCTTYKVEDGEIREIIYQDGSSASYYPGSFIKSTTDAAGNTTEYEYGISDTEIITSLYANGTFIDTVFTDPDPLDGLKRLELATYTDPNTTLILHSNGSNGSTYTSDSSTYNHPVTFYGNAKLSTEESEFGGSSMEFDGYGDGYGTSYVSIPDSGDWDVVADTTTPYTIDFWLNLKDLPRDPGIYYTILGQYDDSVGPDNCWSVIVDETGGITLRAKRGNFFLQANAGQVTPGDWNHIAFVKTGSSIITYLNGTKQMTYTLSDTVSISQPLEIGRNQDSGGYSYLNGYVDEIHISKGVARWTTDTFSTPDTEFSGVHKDSGTFISDPIEIDATQLGSISWDEVIPQGTDISIQTRTGNTSMPDPTWSEWSEPVTDNNGSQITSPAGKYLQYKVTLSTSDILLTSELTLTDTNGIDIAYTRGTRNPEDLTNLTSLKVTTDTVVSNYDHNGVNLNDPNDIINLDRLIFDSTELDGAKEEMPCYILNETQKGLYFDEDIIIAELTEIKGITDTTRYSQGQIIDITKTDGTFIKDIVFDSNNVPQSFTYIKDCTTYKVEDGEIREIIYQDGSSASYYPGSFIKSTTDAAGNTTEYEYGISDTEIITSLYANGTFIDTVFTDPDPLDGLKRLELATYTDPNTTLILHSNGSNGSTYTSDSSTYNHPVTFYGNAKLSTEESEFGGSSMEFDGYGDGYGTSYVSIPDSGDWDVVADTTTPYTIDFWLNLKDLPRDPGIYYTILGQYDDSVGPDNCWSVIVDETGGITLRAKRGNFFLQANAGQVTPGDWNHIAFVKTGSSIITYLNGTKQMTYTLSDTVSISQPLEIGRNQDSGGYSYLNGYVDEIHISKGVARWTTDTFSTPDTEFSGVHKDSGTFISDPIEIDATQLGSISWDEVIPQGTDISIQTRTGNTSMPDPTWSEWSEPVTDNNGSQITSPAGKYIQYRTNLTTNNNSETPRLALTSTSGVAISYTRNSVKSQDIDNLSYIKITENGITKTYNASGMNVDDPQDTISISSMLFNSTELEALKKDIPSDKLSDAQKVITIYDKGNDIPVEIVTAGQSITYFDQGFATRVVDKNGITQVIYTYDENKNVIKVEFVDARQKLEENYQKALTEITLQKELALEKLAKAEADARVDIASKSADIQIQINAERARLEQEKTKYDPNIYDLSEFDRAFSEIDDYETKLAQQTQDAYVDLDNQVVAARARIEADASTAMQDLITNDYNKILADIVQKESTPLIYQYYRKVLGRDPGDDDLLYWTDRAKTNLRPFTATEITQYLENLPEYADRQARKQSIITDITGFFTQYLSVSDTEKESMLLSLGFTPDEAGDIIQNNLTQSDIDSILSWLNGQSLHFGDSAFETVISMLKNEGIARSFEDIGKDAIKIDILTGVITKDTTGDLLISMYAMRKAAQINTLALYSNKITYDDLKDMVLRDNVIVHIDGKHYVLVTSIDDQKGTITYTDPTVSANGQEMTLSRAEFMETWRGYSLSKELPQDPAKHLNATQEKNIRGSGWWEKFWKGIVKFFQKIVAPVAAILLMIPPLAPIGAVLAGINIVIQTISFVVHTGTLMDIAWAAISGIGAALGAQILPGIFDAVGNAFGAIGSAITDIFGTVGQLFAPLNGIFQATMGVFNTLSSVVSNIATGIGNIFTPIFGEAIGSHLAIAVIETGVKLGTDFLFKSLGVDPSLASIGSALLSGAIMGALTPGDMGMNIVEEALTRGTIATAEELGRATDLDPNITHLAAMMAGTLVNGALDINGRNFTYDELMENIAPTFIREATKLGVIELGEILGVDNRLSYMASLAISSTIGTGIDSGWNPRDIFQSVTTGLLQGVTSIGINYATQELGLNPILANLGFSAIASMINSGIQATIGTPDSQTGERSNFFESIFKTYTDNILTFLGYGNAPNRGDEQFWTPIYDELGNYLRADFNQVAYDRAWGQYYWQQSTYTAQILDFTNIVKDKGLVEALDIYGTGFLNAVAVNQIVQSGNTLGNYFMNELNAGHSTIRTLQDGKQVRQVAIKDAQGNTVANVFFEEKQDGVSFYWDVVGKEEFIGDSTYISWGDPGVDAYAKLGYSDAEIYAMFDSDIQYQRVIDGQQAYVEIKDSLGNTLLVIEPTEGGHYNVYNSYGEYENAKILSTITDMKFDIVHGASSNVTIGQGAGEVGLTISSQDFSGLLFSAVENGKIVLDKLIKQPTWQGLVGIAEAAENITSPLTDVANLAINRISSGQSVDLATLASASTWQSIFVTSGFMADWANTATLLFSNSISPALAPGTEMLMNLLGSEAFREQLNNQAAETFNGYNLFEELASVALGNPGSGTIIEQIGAKSFWEWVKVTAQTAWDNRANIIAEANKFALTMLSPAMAQLDTPIGQEFIKESQDFFCLGDFTPIVSDIDPITKTLKVDPALNYANIMQQPISGTMDWITLAKFANIRWDMASQRAAQEGPRINSYITNGSLKGFSISGINDDGANLDSLTKQLSPLAVSSFGITHSAGISTLIRTAMRPERLIITDTQEKRGSLESWLQSMNYSQDKVLLVDVAQDLPYRPTDLIYLSPADIISNLATPADLVTTDINNLLSNNACNDYSSNPNNKYIYMKILSGPGVDRDISLELFPHTAAIVGALDPNAQYDVIYNGRLLEKVSLSYVYEKFLKGEEP